MSAKKPIVVRIDGKQAKGSTSKEGNRKIEKIEKISREEVAAAGETSENKIHTFAREYDTTVMLSKSTTKKKNNFYMFKPIIIAIISAIAIGSIMGFVMLKMIVNFDNDLHAAPAYLIPGQVQEKDIQREGNGGASTSNGSLYKLDPMSAFVLQGGVFSSASGAEAESAKFIEQGYSPVIWEKDNQFFLFVSSGMSKEDLQADINTLTNVGIDVYAKEWVVSESEVKLTKAEQEWVSSFQDNWNIAMGKGSLEIETWKALLGQAPKGSDSFNGFITSLNEQVTSINNKNSRQILLAMWESYDYFITTEQMHLE